jgi:hypothetical protein
VVEYLFKTLNVGMCGVVVFVLTEYCSVIFILWMGVLRIKFICLCCVFIFSFLWERNSYGSVIVSYHILLTIPVTVALAERSFSKLKLIKTYLRTTMSQERLSGLAMISIENEYLDKLNYDDLIEEFALKNARRSNFLGVELC